MDLLEAYYGKLTFTLYGLFASVPGKKSWPRVIFITLGIYLLFLATVYQVTKLVIDKFQFRTIIELLPTIMATLGTLLYVPYVAFAATKRYHEILSIILNDLKQERIPEENEIKKVYADKARIFVNVYTTLLIMAICGIPLSGFAPLLLDLVAPLNESREFEFLFNGEIFLDQKKYFYHIYSHQCCTVFVVSIVIGISENMSVIIGQHACGMNAILGYRIKNVTEIKDDTLVDKIDYQQLIINRLRKYVGEHQRLAQFGFLITAFYDIPLTLILTGSVCSITVSVVQITDPQLVHAKMVIFTIVQIFQLYLVSYMGQAVIDASEELANDAYNAEWDKCPGKARNMLQMIILRSINPCKVIAMNMYTLSIENFMSVTQTMMSCYMVLRQTV